MGVDFGTLQTSKIEYVIDDLDNCLFKYPDSYAERFSVETARAAKLMAQRAIREGSDDERLVSLVLADEDELVEKAVQSYKDHGFTTEAFARENGLDAVALYQGHHYLICRDVVQPTFNRMANPRLQQGLMLQKDAGLTNIVFTNGTEFYAEEVTDQLGIKGKYNRIVGIDSTGQEHLTTKSQAKSWLDMVEHVGIPATTGYKYVAGGDMRTVQDWDYSHCVFFDDTPSNLKLAKEKFGMQTVLVETDRVKITEADRTYIDAVTDDIGEFKCQMATKIMRDMGMNVPVSRPTRGGRAMLKVVK